LTFPSEEQSLINTLWGSTGRVRLFTLDTKYNVFSSNQIAFVDNLNQKVMIDKLKEVATRNMLNDKSELISPSLDIETNLTATHQIIDQNSISSETLYSINIALDYQVNDLGFAMILAGLCETLTNL